ncbi:hypothetical protein [Salinimicrobium gaetbulicola]|uniref:Uncharacterized protein n=1 Tax=Salinimicrobium gaetbulicola TaxID=999702 RepID=A0ABW3IDQ6_9FLAO
MLNLFQHLLLTNGAPETPEASGQGDGKQSNRRHAELVSASSPEE